MYNLNPLPKYFFVYAPGHQIQAGILFQLSVVEFELASTCLGLRRIPRWRFQYELYLYSCGRSMLSLQRLSSWLSTQLFLVTLHGYVCNIFSITTLVCYLNHKWVMTSLSYYVDHRASPLELLHLDSQYMWHALKSPAIMT